MPKQIVISVFARAVVRGDFGIQKMIEEDAYALVHVPSGYLIDQEWKRAGQLRPALRALQSAAWPTTPDEVEQSPVCKLQAIEAIEAAESFRHPAFRRDFSKMKAKLVRQLAGGDE